MANITGHGWRKIMRANRDFTYVIDRVPEPQQVFPFIQEHSNNSDEEMYGNFNMGAGFAVFMPEQSVKLAKQIARKQCGLNGEKVGYVENGPKQVVIRPKGLTFRSETLGVR